MKAAFQIIAGILGLAFVAGLAAWKLSEVGFPVERTLESSDGRSIDAVLLGKQGDLIVIERRDDGSRWDLPINRLSFQDRLFVMRLPEQAPPPVRPPPKEPADPYIANREAVIAELRRKQAMIAAELDSRTLSETMVRRRREELSKTEKEIRQIELSIKSYKYRNKKN